jgi:glycosyltransferase involved in cell wall biosynthesis
MSYVLAGLDHEQITVRHVDSRGRSARPVLSLVPLVRAVVTLVALKASGRVDVVHVNMSYRGSTLRKGVVARVCRSLRIPTILHLHTCEFEEFYGRLPSFLQGAVRATFQRADHVVVLGHVWESFVVDQLRVPSGRVTVLYNAAPGPSQLAPRDAESAREDVRLLFLGQLGARKGVPELLCALARLRDLPVHWSITMAGDGDGGARALASELGILERITFAGWLDSVQVHDLLKSSDILILPSHAEGLPMAIIEAFALGVAVIASSVGAIPEIVMDRETGLLVPAGDLDALEEAIKTLCLDTVLRDTVARTGRKTWESSFEIGSYTERLTDIWFNTIHHEREDTRPNDR